MSDEASKVNIYGKLYKTSDLTETIIKILENIDHIKASQDERKNMCAVLTKAKKAYIAELRNEMISAKSGFNFSE